MTSSDIKLVLPSQAALYYGGQWHKPVEGSEITTYSPATGEALGQAPHAMAADVDRAVAAAKAGFETWRKTPPLERAKIMNAAAQLIRKHGDELAMLDSADGGNPIAEMTSDAGIAARMFEFFAGLVTEIKGDTIPMGPDAVNFTVREPLGVVARIVAFNHPFMFVAGKMAAPLAAGNAVIMKPPEQAPLSGLRLAEIIGPLFPPGVVNILTGGRECGAAMSSHKDIAMVTLVGSVPTGRAIMKAAAETLKPVLFELGGKNALIAFADADIDAVAAAAVSGMNYTWCGQSCGSMSRVFLHEDIHDAVIERMGKHIAKFKPGLPTEMATTMGAIVSRVQYDKILGFIDSGKSEGATVAYGGGTPKDAALSKGYFIEPTVFTNVKQSMRIASEEIFGPVQSVIKWSDQAKMLEEVNSVEYGLTASIFTANLGTAHRMANEVQAGYVWVNHTSQHFLGAPFGGFKQSGIGREECLGELISFTQEKNIHIRLAAGPAKH